MTSFILIVIIVTLSNFFIDADLALFVDRTFYGNSHWSRYTSAIPDVLFAAVCVITTVAALAYFYRIRKGIYDAATRFFLLVAAAVPASFALKFVLKWVFGRINTRVWLHQPHLYGFQWFHGGRNFEGFPSGHMLVITTFAAALWRLYPRYRSGYLLFLLLLAGALIATNYHFFSDVVAGAYLGVVVEMVISRAINRQKTPIINT